jgi:hypothetical protein
MIALLDFRQRFGRLRRILARNEAKLNLGPPFGREPFKADSVREAYHDLDGMDELARKRAAIIRGRKQFARIASANADAERIAAERGGA